MDSNEQLGSNAMNTSAWPQIDPSIHAVGVSKLRRMTSDFLRKLDSQIYIIQDNDKPLAVVVNYEQFLALQKEARNEH